MLIIGNSHSKDTFNELQLNKDRFPGYEFARFGMGQLVPEEQIQDLLASPNFKVADQIVIGFRYLSEEMDAIERLMRAITAEKSNVLMLGNTVEFPMIGNLPLFDWYAQTHPDTFDVVELGSIAYQNRDPRVPRVNAVVKAMAQEFGAAYFDKAAYMCDDDAQSCLVVGAGNRKLMYDNAHYTIEGARTYGERIQRLGWFSNREDWAAAKNRATVRAP